MADAPGAGDIVSIMGDPLITIVYAKTDLIEINIEEDCWPTCGQT